jgi:hypothetical protein
MPWLLVPSADGSCRRSSNAAVRKTPRLVFKPLKVLDIELCHPLEDIRGLDRYEAVQALVRLCGRPIGYVNIPRLRR